MTTTKKPKSKRPRLADDGQTSSSATSHVSLANLPIEILAEILLLTRSPPTVLAVSRTCTFLYRTLAQNPSTSFIWRGVRETCRPSPLPDPTRGWNGSEADYAAFLFCGGVCAVCRKATSAMYSSFATRIRLCGSWPCRRKMLSEMIIGVVGLELETFDDQNCEAYWVPYIESNSCFYPSTSDLNVWPSYEINIRRVDLEAYRKEHLHRSIVQITDLIKSDHSVAPDALSVTAEEELRRKDRVLKAKQRHTTIMELSARLIRWRYEYDREYKEIKERNQAWTRSFAEQEGWNLKDLSASETYGSFQCRQNHLLEKIEPSDVSSIRSTVEAELVAIQARRKRRKAEGIYKEKLKEVKKIHERMHSGTLSLAGTETGAPGTLSPSELTVPTWNVFCTLPFVRTLKGSPDPSMTPPSGNSSANNIQLNPLITSLIASGIHTWMVPVQKHLMGLLGYPSEWQSASARILPPLKRVTARFFCKRCGEGKVSRKFRREKCLDLQGVCSHVCTVTKNKSTETERQEVPEASGANTDTDDHENEEDESDGEEKCKDKWKSKRKKHRKVLEWKVNVFEKDEKAIKVIKSILDAVGLSEEDPGAVPTLNAKGGVIRCLSCTGWIVMDFATAVGHAHRHESMRIQLVPHSAPGEILTMQKEAGAPRGRESSTFLHVAQLSFRCGNADLLLGPAYCAQRLVDKVDYGCKHCFRVFGTDIVANLENPVLKVIGKGVRPMNFNALRSHVKAKHGVQDISDEDFFCYSLPSAK